MRIVQRVTAFFLAAVLMTSPFTDSVEPILEISWDLRGYSRMLKLFVWSRIIVLRRIS